MNQPRRFTFSLSRMLLAVAAEDDLGRPFAQGGAWGWAAWLAGVLLGLAVQRDDVRRRVSAAHIGLLSTIALVLGFEARELALSPEPPLGEGWFVPAFGVPKSAFSTAGPLPHVRAIVSVRGAGRSSILSEPPRVAGVAHDVASAG